MPLPLPFNKLTDGTVAVTNNVVTFGTQREQTDAHFLSWLEPHDVCIDLSDDDEFELWTLIPDEICVFGCGSPGTTTTWMAFDARGQTSVLLSQAIMELKFVRFINSGHRGKASRRLSLGPERSHSFPGWLQHSIQEISSILPGPSHERTAVAAGLHLLYDDLDGSHSLSQTIEGRGKNHNGDYWHAIMHRREPDYGNSKYWFRHVGLHPVFRELPSVLERIQKTILSDTLDRWVSRLVKSGEWDPFAFVDACEAASEKNADPEFRRALEEIQHFEMLHLLRQSCFDAGFTPKTAS